MRNMEFLGQNLLNTTTMVSVASGTGTTNYLFDRSIAMAYASDGYTGSTKTSITVTFGAPTVISRVMIQNHNLKAFRLFYDGVTATVFTPDCIVSANSSTSHYFAFNSTTVSSITLQTDDVIATGERSVGELVISDSKATFDYNPDSTNYDPKYYKQKVKHIMPDGGTSLFIAGSKFQAALDLKFISTVFKDSLRDLYDYGAAMYFVSEATTSGWVGEAHEVVWVNDWDFTYSENSRSQGYNGKIVIEETSNT